MIATRSPKYPSLNLAEALERIKKVYSHERRHPATDEIIVGHLGYKSLNGASTPILATLKRYGLLVPAQDGKFQVSEEAISIIEPSKGRLEPNDAIRSAAFRPQIFADLHAEYGEDLPSDQNLRRFLIDEKRFNPQAAVEVIRVYRETMALVETNTNDYTEEIPDESQENFSMQSQPTHAFTSRTASPQNLALPSTQMQPRPDKVLSFQTFEGSEAVLHLPPDVTRESISLIIALLNAQQVAFPVRQSPEAPIVSSPPILEEPQDAPALPSVTVLALPTLPASNE